MGTQLMTTKVTLQKKDDALATTFNSVVSVETEMLSKPQCEVADVKNRLSTVALVAYQADDAGSEGTCSSAATTTLTLLSNVAVRDNICYRLEADMDKAVLEITKAVVTFYEIDGSPSTNVPAVFTSNEILAGGTLTGSNKKLQATLSTNTAHAGLSVVLVVDFEQKLEGETRRLRQTFALGSSPGHRESSVHILPASVQVADEIEAATETEVETATETEAEVETISNGADHEGLGEVIETSSGIVIGSIAGGVLVLLGGWLVYVTCSRK